MKAAAILTILPLAVESFVVAPSSAQSSTSLSAENVSRRSAVNGLATIFLSTVATSSTANALDMDAFMNAELANDTKNCDPKRDAKCAPKMSEDEALCKYGQGKAKVEACRRLRNAGQTVDMGQTGGKSLGGAYAM